MGGATDCTAGTIATPDPDYRAVDDDARDTAAWLDAHDYDATPVYDDGVPVGYVTLEEIAGADPGVRVGDVQTPLGVAVIISPDAPFDVVLEALYDRPFYYLADRNEVTGVLTRADLNIEPVYQHLYTLLSRLERVFREVIQAHAPDWRETASITPSVLDDIDERRAQAATANVALAPIHYAQFSTLTRIIAGSEDCRAVFGFDSEHQARSRLKRITDLRNDVAHTTPILQNTNQGIAESGRTVTDLIEQYELIEELLATVEE